MEASAETPRTAPGTPAPEGAAMLRMLGGVAFAVGAVALYLRKSGVAGGADWAAFPLLLVVGVPFVLLLALAIANRRVGEVERWRAALLVTAVLLAPLALEQLRDTLGLSSTANFWHFLVFSAVAVLAAYGSFVVGAAYQAFLAGIAGIVAWRFLWDWILSDPGVNAFRWLFLILALGYLGAGLALRAGNEPQGDELITVAGILGLLVGVLGLSAAASAFSPFGVPSGNGQGFFWDFLLLVVSLASVAYGALNRVRGPAYVGFVGLVLFALTVGLEVNALLKREPPDGSLAGWPLALLLIGGVALAAGVAAERRSG
jgi:hypothetical protein